MGGQTRILVLRLLWSSLQILRLWRLLWRLLRISLCQILVEINENFNSLNVILIIVIQQLLVKKPQLPTNEKCVQDPMINKKVLKIQILFETTCSMPSLKHYFFKNSQPPLFGTRNMFYCYVYFVLIRPI